MTKKKIIFIAVLVFVGLVVLSIIGAGLSDWLTQDMGTEPELSEERAAGEYEGYTEDELLAEVMPDSMAAKSAAGGKETAIEKKIIKTGDLDLVVEKVSAAVEQITELAITKAGFVSQSNIYTRDDKTQYGVIVIRVPSKDFEATIKELKAMAEIVESESISGVDVTEEFVDLESRLKNLRIKEEQYQKIMKNAKTTEDILKVTDYLFDTREDIELIEGRIKYLEDLTSLATIRVDLSETPKIEIPIGGWKPLMTVKKVFRAWVKSWQGVIDVLISMLFFVVPWIIIFWVIIAIIKARIRRRKSRVQKVLTPIVEKKKRINKKNKK